MLRHTMRLKFCYLKIIHIFRPHYHPKITRRTLKSKEKKIYVYIHEIIQLIMIKMKKQKKKNNIDTT